MKNAFLAFEDAVKITRQETGGVSIEDIARCFKAQFSEEEVVALINQLNTPNSLPHTHEEVLQNLSKHPEAVSKNEVERMATEVGVDYDADTKDEYNREKE